MTRRAEYRGRTLFTVNQLSGFLKSHDSRRFDYGQWDCLIFSSAWFEVLTGRNPAREFIGTYTSEYEAARIMHRRFGGGLHETLSHFATPVSNPKTGDLALARFERDAAAIVNGPVLTGLGAGRGFVSVGRHALIQGYRING